MFDYVFKVVQMKNSIFITEVMVSNAKVTNFYEELHKRNIFL